MSSKGYKRFVDRLDFFRTDNEVAEILVLNKEQIKGEIYIFDKVSDKHQLLSRRKNRASSRSLVVNHLRHTLYVAFMKELYEEVTEYLKYILQQGALNGADTNRIVGEHKLNMKANDVLQYSTMREIVKCIMDQVFQQLEQERSTISLITKTNKKLGLNINQDIIDAAVYYLEIRHILVHSDGKPTGDFLLKYPQTSLDGKGRILLDLNFTNEAYETIRKMLFEFDKEMMTRNYFSSSEKVN